MINNLNPAQLQKILIIFVIITKTLTFTPTIQNYDSLTIKNAGKISFSSDGSAYSIIHQSAVQYYKKINGSYIYIDQISPVCSTNTLLSFCQYSWQWMSSNGQRLLYIHNSSPNVLKVVKIVDSSTLIFAQNINFASTLTTSFPPARSVDSSMVQAK